MGLGFAGFRVLGALGLGLWALVGVERFYQGLGRLGFGVPASGMSML